VDLYAIEKRHEEKAGYANREYIHPCNTRLSRDYHSMRHTMRGGMWCTLKRINRFWIAPLPMICGRVSACRWISAPLISIIAGLAAGYRFQKGDAVPSTNYSGYVYFHRFRRWRGDLALNVSYLKNNFLTGTAGKRGIYTQHYAGYERSGLRTFVYSYAQPTGKRQRTVDIPYADINPSRSLP